MTTINNLTIEQMREIIEWAPEGATHYRKLSCSVNYSKNISKSECYIWNGITWRACISPGLVFTSDLINSTEDLRTAIAEYDNTDIGTEIDSFLDAFKSPELTDDRKEELTQDWKGMSGGVAFSLIERHADNWKEIDYMMNQWLEANKEAERHG